MDRVKAFEVARETVGDQDQTFENAEGKFGISFSYYVAADQAFLVGHRQGYGAKKQAFQGDTDVDLRRSASDAMRKLRDDLGVPFEQVVGGKPQAGDVKRGAYLDPKGGVVNPAVKEASPHEAETRSRRAAASTQG